MPLISVRKLTDDVQLGLWKIDETAEEFFVQFPYLEKYRDRVEKLYASGPRRREFLAVRALLHVMAGPDAREIRHEASGRPVLGGWQVSISHTRGFAALILSRERSVAVDIEYVSNRVDRVADRFLRPDEETADTTSRLIVWSAKETVYKYFSDDDLRYHEMQSFVQPNGICVVVNFRRMVSIPVTYELTPDYVLTYAYDE